jgi:hypothetical protein
MANPVVIDTTAATWSQVAASVKKGTIIILQPRASYRITYRVAGNPPPSTQQEIDEAPKVQSLTIMIQSDADIDVYIYTVQGEDGQVTVYV